MLRLLDAHTGSRAEVKPARLGLLRVCAHVPGDVGVSGATALRVLLVADLVARVAELGNLQPLTVLVTGDESAERMSALESAASALGIHPPAGRARSGNARRCPAARLALMSFRLHQPADLTGGVVPDARETVRDWRRRVARWAESPSKPVPAHLAEAVQAAFDDLDAPSIVALLHGLAHDDSVPAGAKFETFVYVDRVLSLDLPSEIGKPA